MAAKIPQVPDTDVQWALHEQPGWGNQQHGQGPLAAQAEQQTNIEYGAKG